MKLGDWLVSKNKITEEHLARALQDQAFFGGRLGHSLIKLGFVDEDTLGAYLADISRTPYAPPARLENITPEALAAVPARLAGQYRIVPIAIEGRRLHLAMRDPLDLIALDEIAFLTGLTIQPYVATEFRIHMALERYYQITFGTRTIPLAGPAPEPPPRPATRVARPPKPPPDPVVGLDGYPLDADPNDLDQPFLPSGSGDSPALRGPTEPLPRSMEEWRMAREEIPESLPEPPTRPAPAIPAPAPRAASAAPAAPPNARPGPDPRTVAAARSAPAAAPPGPSPAAAPRGLPSVTAASPAASPLTAVPAPALTTLEGLSERLRASETRDEIFDALLDFTAPRFRRCALFIVQPDRVLGWSGRGDGISAARIRNVTVGFDRPSLFVFFRKGGDYYYGPVPDLPANARFYLDLGCPPPGRVLLLPLRIKDRPAVVLYADHGSDGTPPPDIPLFRRAMRKAALALEILILRNKIMML